MKSTHNNDSQENIRHIRYTQEGYQVGTEPEIMETVTATTVMWLGHLVKSNNMNLCRKMTFTKAEGTRREGGSSSPRW